MGNRGEGKLKENKKKSTKDEVKRDEHGRPLPKEKKVPGYLR